MSATLVIEDIDVTMPVLVMGLVAIASATYDPSSQVRGWGAEYLGAGITVDDKHYSCNQVQVEIDGKQVHCVKLVVRPGFWGPTPGKPVEYLFPFDALKSVQFSLQAVLPEGD